MESAPSADFPALGESSASAWPLSPGVARGGGAGPSGLTSIPIVSPSSIEINLFPTGTSPVRHAVDKACDTNLSAYDFFGDVTSISDDSDVESHVTVDSYMSDIDVSPNVNVNSHEAKESVGLANVANGLKDISSGNDISGKDVSNGAATHGNKVTDNSKDVSKGAEAHVNKVIDIVANDKVSNGNLFDNINSGATNNLIGPDSSGSVDNDNRSVVNVSEVIGTIPSDGIHSGNPAASVNTEKVNDLLGSVHDGDVSCGVDSGTGAEACETVVNNINVIDNSFWTSS